jgi:hypothetical protein
MNVEIGTEAAQFPEKEYLNGISFAVKRTNFILARWWTRCGSVRCEWRPSLTSRVVASSWRTTTVAAGRRDSGATRSRRSYTPSAGHAGRIGVVSYLKFKEERPPPPPNQSTHSPFSRRDKLVPDIHIGGRHGRVADP